MTPSRTSLMAPANAHTKPPRPDVASSSTAASTGAFSPQDSTFTSAADLTGDTLCALSSEVVLPILPVSPLARIAHTRYQNIANIYCYYTIAKKKTLKVIFR